MARCWHRAGTATRHDARIAQPFTDALGIFKHVQTSLVVVLVLLSWILQVCSISYNVVISKLEVINGFPDPDWTGPRTKRLVCTTGQPATAVSAWNGNFNAARRDTPGGYGARA